MTAFPTKMLLSFIALASLVVAEEAEADGGGVADFSVALMLLASVTFMMSTFYLVNMDDEDLRQAAWLVISATISIFCAVLLFQAVNGIVEQFILGEEPLESEGHQAQFDFLKYKLMVNCGHAMIWYLSLCTVLAAISGAVSWEEISECRYCPQSEEDSGESSLGDAESGASGDETEEDEEEAEEREQQHKKRELDMKCWAVLFGHTTGFACINAFGTLQGMMIPINADDGPLGATSNNLIMTGSTAVAAFLTLTFVFAIIGKVRSAVMLGDDGEKDEKELLWDAETVETEDDVMGLTVSFVTVQVVRYWLVNALPNEEGELEGSWTFTLGQVGRLILTGFVVFAIHVLRTQFIKGDLINHRIKEQFKVICGMIFAWCFFFGMQMFVEFLVDSYGLQDAAKGVDTIKSVGVAVLITFCCYVMIFVLDKIADADWSDKEIDKSIRELIKALGILVGFAWEKSFDAAVVSISNQTSAQLPPSVTKLIMTILIGFTVIPAWRWYILPQLQEMGCFDGEEEEAEAEEEDGENGEKTEEGGVGLEKPLLEKPRKAAAEPNIAALKKADQERREQIRSLQQEAKSNADQAKKIAEQIKGVLEEVVKVKEALVER